MQCMFVGAYQRDLQQDQNKAVALVKVSCPVRPPPHNDYIRSTTCHLRPQKEFHAGELPSSLTYTLLSHSLDAVKLEFI